MGTAGVCIDVGTRVCTKVFLGFIVETCMTALV